MKNTTTFFACGRVLFYLGIQNIHEYGVLYFDEIRVRSGIDICVGDGKHVHFVCGTTEEAEGHTHDFVFATLIENPIGD